MTEIKTDNALIVVPAISFFFGLFLFNKYNLSSHQLVLYSALFSLLVYCVFVLELNLIIKWRDKIWKKK